MNPHVTIANGGARCPVHGLVRGAAYGEQHPAPCGCSWSWDEATGHLVAMPYQGPRCDCGAPLPKPPAVNRGAGVSQCSACGQWWRYDYYSLGRWQGDTGTGGLTARSMP